MFLKRDTKVYLRKLISAGKYAIWEIPVMAGFNFSQGNTTSEVVLKEMATASGTTRRGRRVFNDALAPAEWSFSTYIRPFIAPVQAAVDVENLVAGVGYKILSAGDTDWAIPSGSEIVSGSTAGTYFTATTTGTGTGTAVPASIADAAANHHAIEEVLWAQMVGTGAYTPTTYTFANLDAPNTTDMDVLFTGGNNITLGTFDLYFVLGATYDADTNYDSPANDSVVVYKISDCVVNQATINFDVDGIAMIEWTGMGTTLDRQSSFKASTAITQGITATSNFIRNKLTALTLLAANTTKYPGAANNDTPGTAGSYNITLTGGSVTFTNNVQYLTPETLGVVNRPIGHIAGNRSVTGNITAYVEEDATLKDTSGQLLADALADVTTITNSFAMTLIVGGSGNSPRMHISLPTAHLEIPKVQSEDVMSVDIAFHGLPSVITAANEASIKYVGAAL